MAGGNTTLHRLDEYFISKLRNHGPAPPPLFEVWGVDHGEIGTCVELFTITPAIWKLE